MSSPENSYGPLGANLTLDCEARGYPAPTITWQFVSTEGKTISLPSRSMLWATNHDLIQLNSGNNFHLNIFCRWWSACCDSDARGAWAIDGDWLDANHVLRSKLHRNLSLHCNECPWSSILYGNSWSVQKWGVVIKTYKFESFNIILYKAKLFSCR